MRSEVRAALRLASSCAAVLAASVGSAQPTADFSGAATAAPASAAPAPSTPPNRVALVTIEGRIIGEEEGNLVIDIGARVGASAGDAGELWRPVQMRHPVTKRVVEDRYRIGTVRLSDALQVMSFAHVEGDVRQEPRPGDIVVMRVAPPEALLAPSPAKKTETAVGGPRDHDADAVVALVESSRGKDLGARIDSLEAWLRTNPRNRYSTSLGEELRLLKRLASRPTGEPSTAANFGGSERDASAAAMPSAPPPVVGPVPGYEEPRVQRFIPPDSAFSAAPLDFGIDVTGVHKGVVLHSRHAGEVGYQSTLMRPAGADFWVATIDGDRMRAPGLDYFIEIVRSDGVAVPAVAGPDAPLHVVVRDAPKPAPAIRHRSTASAYTDYADYNRLHGNDRAWQTEGFLGMRFNEIGLRALRTGFGVYRGVGGSVADLDVGGLSPRQVGLTYGYLEGEAGISPTVSIVGRAALGLGDTGISGGGQLHLRIGSDLDTNLMIGGEVLGGIGLRGIGQMAFFPQSRFPSLVRIEVTNQPGGDVAPDAASLGESTNRSDIAARVILQGGYRILPPLVVFARLSYQGRTIVHAGPGIGGGATFEW